MGSTPLDRHVEQLLDQHQRRVPADVRAAVRQLAADWRRLDHERSRWTSHLDDALGSIETARRLIAATDRPRVNPRIADVIRASHAPTHPAVRRLERDDAALHDVIDLNPRRDVIG